MNSNFDAYVTAALFDRAGRIADHVSSYFGLRTVGTKDGSFLLNGEPYVPRLVLDQGYFPGGLLTAADDRDLRRDIQLAKSMGFNGIPTIQADRHCTGRRCSRSAQRSTSSWSRRATSHGRPGEMLLKRTAFMPARVASCAACIGSSSSCPRACAWTSIASARSYIDALLAPML